MLEEAKRIYLATRKKHDQLFNVYVMRPLAAGVVAVVAPSSVTPNQLTLVSLGVFVLDVTGGEPPLYRNLIEMLALAKKMRFFPSVTTNGMLYPKFAEQHAVVGCRGHFLVDLADPLFGLAQLTFDARQLLSRTASSSRRGLGGTGIVLHRG